MAEIWMDVDAALSEVPVNVMPLIDDTDFKSIEASVAYNAAGMALKWNFVTTAGAYTQTAVTPTTGGDYDWASQGNGMYSIEIPASGGASINNDTEGFGWFSGVATGVLPWRGPTIGFRAAALNNALIDSAYSATRGLAGTALPDAAAEAAGGLYTRGTGAGQINQDANGRVDTNIKSVAGTAASGSGTLPAGSIDAAAFAADTDVYTMKVVLIDDNAGTADLWLVAFFKNGVPYTGTVTSPTIQVIKAADGTDLVASTALSQIGSTKHYKKSEASNRVVDGSGYVAVIGATLGGSARTWSQPIGRDSAA